MNRSIWTWIVVLATLGLGSPSPVAAKSAFFEIRNACPCPGPTLGGFWRSREERLGCVDRVLGNLRNQGWPESVLSRDRTREASGRCGVQRFQCDGTASHPCPRGFVCEAVDPVCGTEGVPSLCSRPRELRRLHGCANEPPACGCNGVTYRTPCALWRDGAVLAHSRSCDDGCGGPDHVACPTGETCVISNCGDGGEFGFCVSSQSACEGSNGPVCGCDGQSYGSACAAASAGVAVRHFGVCS